MNLTRRLDKHQQKGSLRHSPGCAIRATTRSESAISRFYENCNANIPGKKGYPQFKHNSRSVEYKTSGWKLDESRRYITFSDGKKIGRLKLVGTRDLNFYQIDSFKRVRLVRRADGYYAQFCVAIDVVESVQPSLQTVGLDVGSEFLLHRQGPDIKKKTHGTIGKLRTD